MQKGPSPGPFFVAFYFRIPANAGVSGFLSKNIGYK